MEIIARGDGFGIPLMMTEDLGYEFDKGGALRIWSKVNNRLPMSISTGRGQFVEALDENGKIIGEGGDGNMWFLPVGRRPLTLRYKELPDPQLSKVEMNKCRKRVTRYLVADAPYSLGIPDTLAGAIKWMQDRLGEIPKASQKTAAFRFDTTMEYGETNPEIVISYEEAESDEEVLTRLKAERERARIAEIQEREKLRQLKAKYSA